jgi:rubrerythrin
MHILILSGLLAILLPVSASAEVTIFEPYWMPQEPEAGSEFTILAVVKDTNGTGPLWVRVEFENGTFEMMPAIQDPESDRWKDGVLHRASATLDKGGDHVFQVIAYSNDGNISSSGMLNLTVIGKEDEKEDTILGMPRAYCSISIIFITLMIIFLTYSYFKGRRMQKGLEAVSGASKVACSDCGKPIDPMDEKCPHCGAEFEEEEHLCGKCGKVISKDDAKCPHCGTPLKTFKPTSPERGKKKDPDLEKLKKGEVDMKGKIRCGNCGAVYLKKEGSCPECSSKD